MLTYLTIPMYSNHYFYSGTAERGVVDCRTEGCGQNAECIREQAFFVCRCLPGTSGRPEVECRRGKCPVVHPTPTNGTLVTRSSMCFVQNCLFARRVELRRLALNVYARDTVNIFPT